VKKKADSKGPWDYYAPVRKIPAAEAFLPVNVQNCAGG
jgi:branched-chain amino acid transport system substrate-binding protein